MKIEPSKAILSDINHWSIVWNNLSARGNQSDVPSRYTVTASKVLHTIQNIISWYYDKYCMTFII